MRKSPPIYCASCGADAGPGELQPCGCGSVNFVSGIQPYRVSIMTSVLDFERGIPWTVDDRKFLRTIRVSP
jgi:hypothetical protein